MVKSNVIDLQGNGTLDRQTESLILQLADQSERSQGTLADSPARGRQTRIALFGWRKTL